MENVNSICSGSRQKTRRVAEGQEKKLFSLAPDKLDARAPDTKYLSFHETPTTKRALDTRARGNI